MWGDVGRCGECSPEQRRCEWPLWLRLADSRHLLGRSAEIAEIWEDLGRDAFLFSHLLLAQASVCRGRRRCRSCRTSSMSTHQTRSTGETRRPAPSLPTSPRISPHLPQSPRQAAAHPALQLPRHAFLRPRPGPPLPAPHQAAPAPQRRQGEHVGGRRPHLPTSRHISPHLATSRHISPHLATSRHISLRRRSCGRASARSPETSSSRPCAREGCRARGSARRRWRLRCRSGCSCRRTARSRPCCCCSPTRSASRACVALEAERVL